MASDHIKIYEVGPRDGLQNESQTIPAKVKVELINRLSESGLSHIEATSFVSPKAIPQLADHTDIMAQITRTEGVTYPVLVPNMRGMDGALAANVTEIALFTAASESFTQKNINASIDKSFERFSPVIEAAKAQNIKIRGYVSCVAGCPYEGQISPTQVAAVSKQLYDAGCYEISLGDTIGIGTPNVITDMLHAVRGEIPIESIALHMHDTYGQALANIYAGLDLGVRVIDSSVAGLGGCPYAKGASGNVATEDVLYMLHGLGFKTDVNLDRIVDAAWFISNHLDRAPASKVSNALKNKEQD